MSELPVKSFKDQIAFETWLATNFDSSAGLWLRIAKKDSSEKTVNYQEALDVALCYGWIDGQKQKFDDTSWLQKFTPRGPRSIWSKINQGKVAALIDAGRMKPAGHAAIERAKANGQWEAAYDSHSTSTIPEDLEKALSKNPKARKFFTTLNSQNRYAILWRLQTAKKAETRKKRLDQFIEMLAKGETLH